MKFQVERIARAILGPGVSEPGKFEKLNKDQTGWITVSKRAHGIR